MTLSTSRIASAECDLATLEVVRENFRNHLLMALSEARSATVNMEPRFRDVFMDGLTKEFHPDGNMSDLFSDAFHDAREVIQEHIDDLKDEYALEARRVGHKIAAE